MTDDSKTRLNLLNSILEVAEIALGIGELELACLLLQTALLGAIPEGVVTEEGVQARESALTSAMVNVSRVQNFFKDETKIESRLHDRAEALVDRLVEQQNTAKGWKL